MKTITKQIDYKINWHAIDPLKGGHTDILADRKHYFNMLRRFLKEVHKESKPYPMIREIFKRYNVHFVNIDDIERVNLDEPK
jgi:hypothetical protein